MKNLAPEITRQRLLIEGLYSRTITEPDVKTYLLELANHLGLRSYGEPIIYSPVDIGTESNQGFDAFLPLIDSGISIYVWSSRKFLAVVLFTCKEFNAGAAINFTSEYFGIDKAESKEF